MTQKKKSHRQILYWISIGNQSVYIVLLQMISFDKTSTILATRFADIAAIWGLATCCIGGLTLTIRRHALQENTDIHFTQFLDPSHELNNRIHECCKGVSNFSTKQLNYWVVISIAYLQHFCGICRSIDVGIVRIALKIVWGSTWALPVCQYFCQKMAQRVRSNPPTYPQIWCYVEESLQGAFV